MIPNASHPYFPPPFFTSTLVKLDLHPPTPLTGPLLVSPIKCRKYGPSAKPHPLTLQALLHPLLLPPANCPLPRTNHPPTLALTRLTTTTPRTTLPRREIAPPFSVANYPMTQILTSGLACLVPLGYRGGAHWIQTTLPYRRITCGL